MEVNHKHEETYYELFAHFLKEAEKYHDSEIRKKAIQTINTPLYSAIVKTNTKNDKLSRESHDLIMEEALYILHLDSYYETNEENHRNAAEKHRTSLRFELEPIQDKILEAEENSLFPFWDFEKSLSDKFYSGHKIQSIDIKDFTLRKSTDTYLYSLITEFFCPLPEAVTQEIYNQQLIQDLEDDLRDLEEDYKRKMPNPILMRAEPNLEKNYNQTQLEEICKDAYTHQKEFVQKYVEFNRLNLTPKYEWIRKIENPKEE